MATTYIAAYKDSDAADTEVSFRQNLGYRVTRIGPTDRVQLDGDSPSSIVWDSGTTNDWILVISTKDNLVSGDPAA